MGPTLLPVLVSTICTNPSQTQKSSHVQNDWNAHQVDSTHSGSIRIDRGEIDHK